MTVFAVEPQPSWFAFAWLESNGWHNLNPGGRRLSLWRRENEEVAVPLLTGAPDLTRRWLDLVTRLAALERSTPEDVQRGIVNQGSDINEWAANHAEDIDYTIPLSALHTLTGTVKASVIAAANATISPRGYFGHSIPHQAREAADHARAGQTRHGSYIIPVISRLPVEGPMRDGMLHLDVALQPYARQVLGTLASALTTIHQLAVDAGQRPSKSTINDSVAQGVSHELCSAIAESLESPSIDHISVNFKWAKALRWNRTDAELVFPAEAGEVVRGMANDLRNSPVVGEQIILGYVRHLDRGEDDEQGRVTLRAPLGGAQRSVRLYLPDAWYHVAGEANLERRTVRVRGQLERTSGRMWEFKKVEDFGIVENLPIEELERLYPTLPSQGRAQTPQS